MTDEPDTAELENRIDKLESTIEKMMPSRRDALKMGGAALAGGSLMAGTASAGTNQVGTIGSASQPVDVVSEDINNADTISTNSLSVDGQASERHYKTVARVTDPADMPLTFNNPSDDPLVKYKIMLHSLETSSNLQLEATLNNISGRYNQLLVSQTGANTTRTDADEWILWRNNITADTGATGAWTIGSGGRRVGIIGNAVDTRRFSFQKLTHGNMDDFADFNKIEVATSRANLRDIHIEVLERDMR